MTRVDIDLNEDVISILSKLQNINDVGIDLNIPVGAAIFENILSLKLLKKELEKNGRVLHFTTEDEAGNTLIEMLDENTSPGFMPEDLGEFSMRPPVNIFSKVSSFLGRFVPRFNILALGGKKIFILGLMLLVGGFVLFKYVRSPKANIKIVVDSQLLARSVSIKVKKDVSTDQEQKILKGIGVSAAIVEQAEEDTTGEKLVGEKAEGEITIYNKTPEEMNLEKGEELSFKDDDEDLMFVLTEDVTIPPIAEKDPTDPATVLVPGQADVDVEAKDIGDKYNIDGSETIEFENYKKAELIATSKDSFTGGKSETKKVVSNEDITNISIKLLDTIKGNSEGVLKKELSKSQELISGSVSVIVQKEEFSNESGDEATKIKLVQEVLVTGLAYSNEDLEDLLDDLIDKFVPEEYVISDEDKEIKVEILGNTDSSILSSSEADLQVTVKTYVVPKISEEDLKDKLRGKNLEEAQKVIGSVRSIKTYELNISPSIPFFKKIPKDSGRISVEIIKADD